jgi:hypothetical protein
MELQIAAVVMVPRDCLPQQCHFSAVYPRSESRVQAKRTMEVNPIPKKYCTRAARIVWAILAWSNPRLGHRAQGTLEVEGPKKNIWTIWKGTTASLQIVAYHAFL